MQKCCRRSPMPEKSHTGSQVIDGQDTQEKAPEKTGVKKLG